MRAFFAAVCIAFAGIAAACTPAPADHAEHAKKEDFGACATCHMPDYQGAAHHVGEKPTTCSVCHASDGWRPQPVHHPWPLSGKHESATRTTPGKTACFDCHKLDRTTMTGLEKSCFGCHEAEYVKAPDHVGHFPVTCQQCHGTTGWKPILADAVFPETPAPAPSASASAAASATPVASSSAAPPKPKPIAPKPTAKPTATSTATTPPWPKVDPTSNASKRR